MGSIFDRRSRGVAGFDTLIFASLEHTLSWHASRPAEENEAPWLKVGRTVEAIQSLADVMKVIDSRGGIEMMRDELDKCVSTGSHQWRELQTKASLPAKYCTLCYVVDLLGVVFWPSDA